MSILATISTIVTIITSIISVVQSFRAKKFGKSAQELHLTLSSMVAALELLPSTNPMVQKAKTVIRTMSEQTGTQTEILANTVQQVSTLMEQAGFIKSKDETDEFRIERAASIVKQFNDEKGK